MTNISFNYVQNDDITILEKVSTFSKISKIKLRVVRKNKLLVLKILLFREFREGKIKNL